MSLHTEELTLIPRRYQEEIFEQAKKENVIAALDTGSGKTLIAVRLIRWVTSKLTGNHKICAFIVPRVPLVEQQAAFLSSQLPLTVRGYYGALVDPWQHDPERWKMEFDKCDVMVMTAQIFLDAMLHAHWSMTQVALLVFDEAHHARKKNPYNQILREFCHTLPVRARPRIFGMTASPIWNINNPLQSLGELEYNMLSKVIGVRENLGELTENSPRPNEITLEYASKATYDTYPYSIWNKLIENLLVDTSILVRDKVESRYFVTLDELGPFAADVYLASYLNTILGAHTGRSSYGFFIGHELLVDTLSSHDLSGDLRPKVKDIMTAKQLLEEFNSCGFEDESFVIPAEWLSPKLRMLVKELCARRHDSFQCMVFVEQRQIAITLAWILPRVSELKSWISPGSIIGHGGDRLNSTQGMVEKKQKQTLNHFKAGTYNLLVSTSVGEEGLDFQACDLVVRFNELRHLVGYLQSRGRARRFNSTYVVMVPSDDYQALGRYERFKFGEPIVRKLYQERHAARVLQDAEEEEEDPIDVAIREQYIIKSTGAVLTYGSAVSLLNHLCALIPRDKFTQDVDVQPKYEGEFQVTVTLPSALPIPRDKLKYEGGVRNTKSEAKAAAAFVACKALFDPLGVFDDHFLPVRKTSGYSVKDADDRAIPEVERTSKLLDVLVCDPWLPWDISTDQITFVAWIHPLIFPEQSSATIGLMTAGPLLTPLPEVPTKEGQILRFATSRCVALPCVMWQTLHDFTSLGLKWCNTTKKHEQLTCFLIILDTFGNPNFDQMRAIIDRPTLKDVELDYTFNNRILLENRHQRGRTLILRELRDDLNPLSEPTLQDSEELVGRFSTYLEYFEHLYSDHHYPVVIPSEGPLLRVEKFHRNFVAEYSHPSSRTKSVAPGNKLSLKKLEWLPMSICEFFALSHSQIEAFLVFPQVIRRITDVYRARQAIQGLHLPPINEDLVIEALSLPCTNLSFNNQRLETLGDTVLKLGVVTYIYNKFPYHHEGQLDCLKRNSVSNRVLVAWANKIDLGRFLSCESTSVRKWRPTIKDGRFHDGIWNAERNFGRRGLQDCMEALLGASFLSGGLAMALETGAALQLCFGTGGLWSVRYPPLPDKPLPSLFNSLQKVLGYQFKCGSLVFEAFTHPTSASDTPSYQRLEFLGDALIDLVVLEYLFGKFPEATSGQLSWAKSRAVWAPSLTTLGIRRLSLHKYLLRNSVGLEQAINDTAVTHQEMDYLHVVVEGWKYDPPKALSDVVESLFGAIFIDSHYDYELVKSIILEIMDPLLQVLHPKLPRDPTSELYVRMAKRGCQKARFERFSSGATSNKQNNAIQFKIHDVVVGEPFHAGDRGLNKAKPLLADRVLQHLETDFSLEDICDCRLNKVPPNTEDVSIEHEDLDDEREDEFAIRAMLELQDVEEPILVSTRIEDDEEQEEEAEVETFLGAMEL